MRRWLRALLLFALCAALFSLPAWFVDDRAAIGRPHGEVWRNLWLQWAADNSWFDGGPPLRHFSLLVDPAGADLRTRIDNVVWPVLVAPLEWRFGPIVAANVGLALALFLNALCAYLFLRRALGSSAAALPVALAYAFGADSLSEAAAGRPAAAGIFAVPLVGWAAERAFETWSPARLATFAATLALATLWSPWCGLDALLLVAGLAGWRLWRDGAKRPLLATGVSGGAYALLLLAAGRGLHVGATTGPQWSDALASLPYFLILLAGLSLLRRDRRESLWWLGAAALIRLAAFRCGPTDLLPAFDVALAIPAGLALQAAFARMDLGEAREQPIVSFLALVALGASFFRVPPPTAPVETPAPYRAIAGQTRGAVLELPAFSDPFANARNLFFQTVHRRPALVARPFADQPEGFPPAAVAAAPGLAELGRRALDPAALDRVDPVRLRRDLTALGVRWVALHADAIPEFSRDLISFWFAQTFGPPVSQSPAMALFELR